MNIGRRGYGATPRGKGGGISALGGGSGLGRPPGLAKGSGGAADPDVMGVPRSVLQQRYGSSQGKGGGPAVGEGIVFHGMAAAGLVLVAGVPSILSPIVLTERSVLDRLVIMPNAFVDDIALLDVRHNNDPLTSGRIPASLFAPDSLWNPPIMRPAEVADPCGVQLVSAAGTTVWAMVTAHTGREPQNMPPGGYRPGIFDDNPRRIIAMGMVAQLAGVAALAAAVAVIPIVEDAVIDRLVIEGSVGSLWNITGITYDNDPAVGMGEVGPGESFGRNSWASPRLGWVVRRSHNLTIFLQNRNAAGGPYTVDCCVTCR